MSGSRFAIVVVTLVGLAHTAASAAPADPPRLKGKPRATQMSVGAGHACARMSDDTARCWGDDSEGELGDGKTVSGEHEGVVTPPVTDVVEVAAGEHLSCARRRDHTVVCWGWNPYGQIGSGDTADHVLIPAAVAGITDAVAIAAGDEGACAIHADGTVSCWGRNDYHQLGDGTADPRTKPVLAKGLDHVVAISIGSATCARRDDGSVWCWGMNEADTPTAVAGVTGAIDVAAGGLVTCVVLRDGGARCWGSSDSGQLARGDEHDGEDGNQPIAPVVGLTGARSIAVTQNHVCAIAGARVVCWGRSAANPDFPRACLQMTRHQSHGGSAAQWRYCAKPTPVAKLAKPIAVGVSGEMSCALAATGAITCWGGDPVTRWSPPL